MAVLRTWRQLPHERRLAAGAAIGLFATLFLPWYQDTVIAGSGASAALRSFSASITGWGAFSFVEAAVLVVAGGVLALLFIRADGGAFHVPGGDGGVITAAGLWACVLILWRIFDKEGGHTDHAQYVTSTGVEWGIFIALGVAGLLAYAGSRIRLANEPEPPLPGEAPRLRRRGRAPDNSSTQRAPDPAPAQRAPSPDEAPTVAAVPDEPPTQRIAPARPAASGGDQRPARRHLEFPDLDEIAFEDPPTARLGRSAPTGRRPPDEPADEQ